MPLLPDGPIDTLGVLDHLLAAPAHLRDALVDARRQTFSGVDDVDAVCFLAAGPERLAVDAVVGLGGADAAVPVVHLAGRTLPRWVADDTLVVVVAHGDRPELEPALRAAVRVGARLVGVGHGPVIETLAERDAPVARIASDAPAARYAVPALTVALWALCTDALGLVDEIDAVADRCVDRAVARVAAFSVADPDPARLARRLGRTLTLAFGAGAVGELAARRWKTMVNDDVKAASFDASLPALAHHELSGWGQHGDVTRQVFSLVTMRHDHEHEIDRAGFDVVDTLMDEVVAARHELHAEGATELAQLIDLWLQVDATVWHLAQEHEIDPGPMAVDPVALLRG